MGFFDKLSGKELEHKVMEYSEVYGEVLLGLHRDLEKLKWLIQNSQPVTSSQADSSANAPLHPLVVFAIGIGVVVWFIR